MARSQTRGPFSTVPLIVVGPLLAGALQSWEIDFNGRAAHGGSKIVAAAATRDAEFAAAAAGASRAAVVASAGDSAGAGASAGANAAVAHAVHEGDMAAAPPQTPALPQQPPLPAALSKLPTPQPQQTPSGPSLPAAAPAAPAAAAPATVHAAAAAAEMTAPDGAAVGANIRNVSGDVAGAKTDPTSNGGKVRALQLQAPLQHAIDMTLLGAIAVLAAATAVGLAVDRLILRGALERQGRPSACVMLFVASTHILQPPAILSTCFSFHVAVDLGALGTHSLSRSHHNRELGPVTHTGSSFVVGLWHEGCFIASTLFAFYAAVIPMTQAVLLVFGERHRYSTDPNLARFAANSLRAFRLISKWASPTLFAFIVLFHLVRSLDGAPFFSSAAVLDVGFTLFAVFCAASALSVFLIPLPKEPLGVRPRTAVIKMPKWVRDALLLSLGILLCGVLQPFMTVSFDRGAAVEPRGSLPRSLEGALMALDGPTAFQYDVSLWTCLRGLGGASLVEGEANSVLGFTMITVFVLGFTAFDLLLLFLAVRRFEGGDGAAKEPCPYVLAAIPIKHAAMLDTCLMGIVLVLLAGGLLRGEGLSLQPGPGIATLLVAELLHLAAHRSVITTVKAAQDAEAAAERWKVGEGAN